MDKSSLFQFLMKNFGNRFGLLMLVVSVLTYGLLNTRHEDTQAVSLLFESKQRLEVASNTANLYLLSRQNKDLDQYNEQVLKIGASFTELAALFTRYPDLQPQYLEVQKKSREIFLEMNERIEKRGKARADKSAPEKDSLKDLTAGIDVLVTEIRSQSLRSWGVAGLRAPVAIWMFFASITVAFLSLWQSHRLKETELEEQKAHVANLHLQSILLDGILNSISEALIVVDDQGRFTRYNTAAQRIIGNRLRSVSSEDDAAEFGFFHIETLTPMGLHELPFARALQGEAVDDLEIFVHNDTHPEGIYVSASSRYLNKVDGSIHGALVVLRDISKRKAIEQEWVKARESALETARKKSDFLAAMSHEIRTPMNGVMGMTTLLAETSLNEEQKDYVGTIKRSADALLRLINDILDHSKIEAGKIQIYPRPFDLKFLSKDIMELFYPTIREKNIELEIDFSGRDEWNFVGDPERVRQILVNLIGNAIKFTEKGSVQIKVEGHNSIRGQASLKFSITDTGVGMSDEESQLLFQKYFQTKSGVKFGGTGLGLSICRQLVELMGGTIGVHSKVGLGSTFWFTLELPETTAEQIPSQKESHFAAIFTGRILLAEDQPVNQRVAVTYLQKLGLQVDVAGNGEVAVHKALKNSYDLIFMDCQMPIMTGYVATQKIRELQEGSRTPIVALTAEGTSGERETCFAAGMDDFLTKPLELDRLVETLHRWLKTSPSVIDVSALEKLKSYMVNNKSLTQALIEDFMQTAPGLLSSLKTSYLEKNLEELQSAAHALKSTSATLGAQALSEVCRKLEDSESFEGLESLLTEVSEQFEVSQSELQKYLTRAAA